MKTIDCLVRRLVDRLLTAYNREAELARITTEYQAGTFYLVENWLYLASAAKAASHPDSVSRRLILAAASYQESLTLLAYWVIRGTTSAADWKESETELLGAKAKRPTIRKPTILFSARFGQMSGLAVESDIVISSINFDRLKKLCNARLRETSAEKAEANRRFYELLHSGRNEGKIAPGYGYGDRFN